MTGENTDTARRRMVSASLLSDEWLPIVAGSPGPYFFVTEGVLTYLPEHEVAQTLARIAARFPGARLATLSLFTATGPA